MRLRVEAPDAVAEGVAPKDSVAINGVCLTVVERDATSMTFDVVPETLARSALGSLAAGARVNVELSLRLGDRLGGHLVYGHVDATARIRREGARGPGPSADDRLAAVARAASSSRRATSPSTA
jgi:riboflavin synthase